MAIQFPPLLSGDPEPQAGDTYLYLVTGEEFECRRGAGEAAQWAAKGAVQSIQLGYKGPLSITQTAPISVGVGDIYSVQDGGVADSSFTGLAGQTITQWNLIIYADPDWVLLTTTTTGPWVRTIAGRIQPAVTTDDLDMVDGDYLISELPLLT